MSTSHVMVFPSVEDGLALVQAPAMACGGAVIATQNTGEQDLFADGKAGLIVPIPDVGAIADHLQLLADNSEFRSAMSKMAVQRVKSIGGWDQYGGNVVQIFSAAVGS
jgi:glycosyltransferase involved in cell wall biosynthesis